jgi:hypothetical protein
MIGKSRCVSLDLAQEIKKIDSSCRLTKNKEGQLSPTVELLTKLSELLSKHWNCQVTESQAYQVWCAVFEIEYDSQQKAKHQADVAFWYGLNPHELTDDQLAGLYANLDRVKCQQRLELGNVDAMDYEQIYSLTMIAYDDEERASKARSQSMKALVDYETKRQGRHV